MSGQSWSWDTALQGVIPPMISPLTEAEDPDESAIHRLVEHILSEGCRGLFVLGGCGEGAWLTGVQRRTVIRAAVSAAAGRVPVLAGVMLPATSPAIEAARVAAGEGADALVVGSPYYYTVGAIPQRRHIESVLKSVPLPILLYNIPQATHHAMLPDTVNCLASDPSVLGIKDSAGDFEAFQQFLALKRSHPTFRVLQGNEHLAAASLLQGADGLVPGMANFAPGLFVALRQAATAGDMGRCASLQAKITDLCTLHSHGHWLPALKAACALMGIGNGLPSSPLQAARADERRAIEEILSRHKFLTRC